MSQINGVCVNKYMLENSLGLQVLAGTRRNHTAEEEPDLGELSELLEKEHRGVEVKHILT